AEEGRPGSARGYQGGRLASLDSGRDPHELEGGAGHPARLRPACQLLRDKTRRPRPVHPCGEIDRTVLVRHRQASRGVTMPGRITRILLVEDNDGDARLIRELLREAASFPHELIHVDRLAKARSCHAAAAADVILLDLSLPDAHGLETVERMLEAAPGVPMIVLTGLDDDVTALGAVHVGAQDYLVKGSVNSNLLIRSIRYARERKRLELERNTLLVQEREARAVAEAAVRARDDVLRVVSHDLGNSLTAVVVTAEVLLRTQLSASEELTRQRLWSICTTAEQMQRLRQDLLDFAMIEAGRLSMERRRVSPRKVLEEAFERHNALAAAKSISFVCSPDEGARAIRADEARLDQVLSNLLNNALKFTPVGGDIVLG